MQLVIWISWGGELVHNYFLIEMKTITAAEANHKFSQLLRTVSQGEDVLIVSRGRSVARVEAVSLGGRGKAREELLRRLQGQALTGSRTWQRDQRYDR
jgi:prevent-host-death family protein